MRNFESSHKLLESVISLTGQRDQYSLELCLIRTLQEMVLAQSIALYELLEDEEHPAIKAMIELGPCEEGDPSRLNNNANDHIRALEDDPVLQTAARADGPICFPMPDCPKGREVYPVMGPDGLVGLLDIICPEKALFHQELVLALLRIYHNYLALLNENDRDVLTGLLNRKAFERWIAKTLQGPRNSHRRGSDNQNLYFAVFDIDHFKRVNDVYGHVYGDEVLLLFARLMSDCFRHEDLLFRYGGEEFVAIVRCSDVESANNAFERFRSKVANYDFPQVGEVTVSIGFVQLLEQSPTTLFDQADKALYYGKEHGRNQVNSYEALVEEGKIYCSESSGEAELF